ncbi:MAG TPA: hypothetical protein VHV82_18650 [Sporichthyaceae bacterium]|nr:hypothetical protein [Sporichthyaceae bacterium]
MTAPVQPDPRTAAVVAHLSEPRLRPYLAATNGNVKEALRLYQWNIDLSGAVYETLHVFEVVPRNAMDAQLSIWNATQTDASTGRAHALDWLMDPAPRSADSPAAILPRPPIEPTRRSEQESRAAGCRATRMC